MLPSHVTVTSTGIYRYRRRTPTELQQYISTKEIARSLGSNQSKALIKAVELSGVIDQAILITKMPTIPLSVLSDLLEKNHLVSKNDDSLNSKDTKSLSYIVNLFIQQSQVGHIEQATQHYLYKKLLPIILHVLFKEANPNINFLTYPRLLKIRTLLSKIPNKKYANYRSIDLFKLVQGVHNGSISIPEEHLNKAESTNGHLKRIKALLIFAQQLGYFTEILPKSIVLQKTEISSRDYKAILSSQELCTVFSSVTDDNLRFIYKVLYYSGMRRSELYKCRVSDIEGILCFDLRASKVHLKTQTSHRIIPVHPELMEKIDRFEGIISSYLPEHLSKVFKRIARNNLSNSERKTLYSLRHTFATHLIANSVSADITSELMGHSHSTMTMNRYVKGYPIRVLKEAIETL